MLLLLFILWTFVDIVRYIRHVRTVKKISEINKCINMNISNIETFVSDIKTYPIMSCRNISDLFYNKVCLADVSVEDLCETTLSVNGLNCNKDTWRQHIKDAFNVVKTKIKKLNFDIFEGTKFHDKLQFVDAPINAWFQPLPLIMGQELIYALSAVHLFMIGYNVKLFPNGLRIWYTKYDKQKGQPLVFYPCIIGGIALYPLVMRNFKQYNLIFPEIPGISFFYSELCPPSPCELVDTVTNFILFEYAKPANNIKFNIAGHSFGNILCNCTLNRYPSMINNYFCIEGQLFFNGFGKSFHMIEAPIKDINITDLVSLPFFQRHLWALYYIQKNITIGDCFIYDLNNEKAGINIYTYHVENDNKISVDAQFEYAVAKKLPLNYSIIKGDIGHGAFVLNHDFQRYVLEKIFAISYKQA